MKRLPKILVVEDDSNNHNLYKKAFEDCGFDVVISQNADGNFLDTVFSIAPDIISMDLMIGNNETKRDGFEAIKLLKSDVRTEQIPVVVLTNFFQEDKVRKAKALGAVDFINTHGQALPKIPLIYLEYLKNPKRYKPSHPIFRD